MTRERAPCCGCDSKADGRLVEILPDGSERDIATDPRSIATAAHNAARAAEGRVTDAAYARNVRGRTGLTQTVFAARIGVPVETVRNWEQGKRSPRGPARALLKVLEQAPETAFAVLRQGALISRYHGTVPRPSALGWN